MAAAAIRTDGGQGPSRPGISDGPDLISNQPDTVLGTIVSLLPTKDGCRTQALSRRWRPIWRSAPLNLDTGSDGGRLPDQTICDILSGHLGPVRRLSIPTIAPLPDPSGCPRTRRQNEARDAGTRFKGWISSRDVLAGLDELDIGYSYSCNGHDVLPASKFRHAPKLAVATFARCGLPVNLAKDFPSLQKLSLYKITLTEEALGVVLAGCPLLRSLLLQQIVGSRRLRVNSPTLKSIGFCVPWNKHIDDSYSSIIQAEELVIEDAPCLERLLPLTPDHGTATIRVIRAPRLKILGSLNKGTSQLHLGTTVFQEMIAASLTTTMRTVKVLALDGVGPDLDVVLNFLKCFPCLEALYLVLSFPNPYSTNRVYTPNNIKIMRKHVLPDDPIECLKLHLKNVSLKVYYGRRLEVDFARFFVLNASVLERMEFGLLNDQNDEWRDEHNMQLQLEDRASRDARFVFKTFAGTTFRNMNKRTHDLSTADPFNAWFLEGFVTMWEV